MRALIIPLSGSLLLLATACSGGNDDGEPVSGGPAAGDNQTAAVASGQRYEHLEGRLPADFPADFPVYADAAIHRGDTIDDRFAIDMRADVPMDEVVNFYRRGLATAPWSVTFEKAGEGSAIFDFQATDGRPYHGQVAVGRLQDLTWILIAMTFEE